MEISKKITAAIMIIIVVVVLLSLYSSLVPVAQTSGDSMSDTSLCAANGCFYNSSRNNDCSRNNVTGGDITTCAVPSSIPLSGFFSGTGIIFIILIIALLLIIIKQTLKAKK